MRSLNFKDATVGIGATQKEYATLHAAEPESGKKYGEYVMVFQLTDEEVETIIKTRKLYYSRWTFGNLFQPVKISVHPPEGVDVTPIYADQ